MSNPTICNRSPAPGYVGGVESGARFSLRSASGVVDRSTVFFHLGAGPAYYPGGVHPRDVETINFSQQTKFFTYTNPAAATVEETTDELKIEKLSAGTVQAATFFFGGLQSPALPEDNLMLEFTLRLQDADVDDITINVADDQHQLAGPECGFVISNTGVTVRFLRDTSGPGGNRWVELHDARLSSTGAYTPITPVIVNHDWDQGQAWTYKVLWSRRLDRVALFVSTGQDTLDSDILLADGTISTIPAVPDDELRDNLPVAFFGHGLPDPTSTSYWGNAYLYNLVSTPVQSGVFPGEHTGVIRSDDVTHYDASDRPRQVFQAWNLLPSVFDDIEGTDDLNAGRLVLSRSAGKSYGFYRVEPTLPSLPVMMDITLRGLLGRADPAVAHSSMEVFVDDGVKAARFCLIYSDNTQYVGFLLDDSAPASLASYLHSIYGWSAETTYRIIFQPGEYVSLYQVVLDSGELQEIPLAGADYDDLPDTRDSTGTWVPSVGFMLNGVDGGEHNSNLSIRNVRYLPNLRLVEGTAVPASPWAASGSGSVSSDGVGLTLLDNTLSDAYYFWNPEPTLNLNSGVTLEFRVKVNSYQGSGSEDAVRTVTGVGVSIDDATYQTMLVFADGGPEVGQIMFLATDSDLDANLLSIREGDSSVVGTYAAVDWTAVHVYRIERTNGVGIRVYLDNIETPVIEFDVAEFAPITSLDTTPMIRFGGLQTSKKNSSTWSYLRYSVSAGIDVAAFPVLSRNEVLARFEHAINVIAEAGTVPEFSGTPAEFDAVPPDPYDDMEWS